MDELEAIKVTFFQECEELLADLEGGLLAMQEGVGDIETVNAVFRAVHSIKGGAGAFGGVAGGPQRAEVYLCMWCAGEGGAG